MVQVHLIQILFLFFASIFTQVSTQTYRNGYLQTGFNDVCGILTIGFIAGGHRAEKYPWMAGILGASNDKDIRSFCGGSLITNRHILTAAHCVHGKRENQIKVRLGGYNFALETEPGVVDYDVRHIIRYPNYAHKSLRNDIAILTLDTVVQYANVITPVCLPPKYKRTYANRSATVVGWGHQGNGRGPSAVLMEVNVPIWNNSACEVSYGSQRINKNVLCAGEPGRDSCEGDSGGPLMLKGRRSKWTLIGVVSGGVEKCGEPGYPGIYTRVNKFLDWIAKHILDNGGGRGTGADAVRVSGKGLAFGAVRRFNELRVNTGSADPRTLTLSFRGPGKVEVSGSEVIQAGVNEFYYRAQAPGLYYLSIESDGRDVVGSPFKIKVA